jgi:hypothetical protein
MKNAINISPKIDKYHKYEDILSTIKSELAEFLRSTGINDVVI